MGEVWKVVAGFERYEVSTLGRVRSHLRPRRGSDRTLEPRILRPNRRESGYLSVQLHDGNGAMHSRRIHTLVLTTFVGPPPPNMECRHFPDATRSNNALSNLSWGTRMDNVADKATHRTMLMLARRGLSQEEVAESFGAHIAEMLARFERAWPRLKEVSASSRSRRKKRTIQRANSERNREQNMKTKAELLAEKQRIEESLNAIRAERIAALKAEIEELADEDGVSFATFVQQSLLDSSPKAARKAPVRGVVPPKYQSPNDSSVTWSGKGPQPAWFTAALAEGYSREMLEIGARPSYSNGNGAAHA